MHTKTSNVETTFLISRLRTYITLHDVCKYIGISPTELTKIRSVKPTSEWKPEQDRDKIYHLGKLKQIIDTGVDKPIDIDCLVYQGKQTAIPVILDGRHRYLAALLRRDETIPVTYSGRQDLCDYLSGKTNQRPRG